MSRNKSVSLFEILPPSGDDEVKQEETQNEGAVAQAAPTRKRVDSRDVNVMPDVTSSPFAAEEIAKKAAPAPVKEKPKAPLKKVAPAAAKQDREQEVYHHNVEGVSVREKNDYFILIVAVLLSFSIITGLVGYRYGKYKGRMEGQELIVGKRSNDFLGIPRPERRVASASTKKAKPAQPAKSGIKVLPVSSKTISNEQRDFMFPKKIKKYGVCLKTFSSNQKNQARELVDYLQSRGIDAYADRYYEVVYAGRFESAQGQGIKQFLNKMKRFKWKGRTFSDAYKVNIPKALIKK